MSNMDSMPMKHGSMGNRGRFPGNQAAVVA